MCFFRGGTLAGKISKAVFQNFKIVFLSFFSRQVMCKIRLQVFLVSQKRDEKLKKVEEENERRREII